MRDSIKKMVVDALRGWVDEIDDLDVSKLDAEKLSHIYTKYAHMDDHGLFYSFVGHLEHRNWHDLVAAQAAKSVMSGWREDEELSADEWRDIIGLKPAQAGGCCASLPTSGLILWLFASRC